jgi:hypothetical protein
MIPKKQRYEFKMYLIIEQLDKIISISLMLIFSIYIRILLQYLGQSWIKTVAHTSTLVLLPILTYVITNVISGNIALSLGMVGALSIVRFRNPVRSPLELTVYFGAITMGITAGVSLKWLLLLVGSVTFVALVLFLLQFFSNRAMRRPFFIASFSEGNNLSTLNVITAREIISVDEHDSLMSKIVINGEINYTLANSSFQKLRELEKELRSLPDIKSLQISR